VPPTFDVYVWVAKPTPHVWGHFIGRYVDIEQPGDLRIWSFIRVYVHGHARDGDREELDDLRIQDHSSRGFSLYLNAVGFAGVILTPTVEGDGGLGLSIDDPDNSEEVLQHAVCIADRLREEFAGAASILGVELPPPANRAEWADAALVQIRSGTLPA
jgi:hypothetical protein